MLWYCPECGSFYPTDEQHCSNRLCHAIDDAMRKSLGGEAESFEVSRLVQATTENRFCGRCNKIFAPDRQTCAECGRATSPLTDGHLNAGPDGGDLVLLSGIAAECVWDRD